MDDKTNWLKVTLHAPREVFRDMADWLRQRVIDLHREAGGIKDKGEAGYRRSIAGRMSDLAEAIRRALLGK